MTVWRSGGGIERGEEENVILGLGWRRFSAGVRVNGRVGVHWQRRLKLYSMRSLYHSYCGLDRNMFDKEIESRDSRDSRRRIAILYQH